MPFEITSAAFRNEADIPAKHTCDGLNLSPPLQWRDPPAGTRSFALIADDPDAPAGTWVHWVLYGLPADLSVLPSFAGLGGVKFGPARSAPDAPMTEAIPDKETRTIHYAVETQTTTFDIRSDDGQYTLDEIGTELTSTRTKTYRIQRNNPTACFCSVLCTQSYRRGDWEARVDSEVAVTSDATHFHVTAWLKAYDHGKIFATREYK